jgi:YegS/Rv2252/BmrU family lipid kinase
VAAGAAVVAAVGGDGTAHEVANGLLDARARQPDAHTALAVVPVGTGNDFAKVIRGAVPRARALRTLVDGTARPHDAGRVHWQGQSEWFVNAMGTGIDGEVVRQLARSRNLPGGLVYLSALVRALVGYRPIPVRLSAEGFRFEGRVMTLAAGNGRCVGGAFQLCPAARPDDGLLDVSIIAALGPLEIVRTLAGALTGRLAGKPGYVGHRTARLTLELPDPGPHHVQFDGELREVAGPATLEVDVQAGVLPVLTDGPGEPGSAGDEGR